MKYVKGKIILFKNYFFINSGIYFLKVLGIKLLIRVYSIVVFYEFWVSGF